MKVFLIFFAVLLHHVAISQKIVKAVMADENGITDNAKKAKFLIVIIEIQRSVKFSFDEESMRVVALLKDWIPASDKGKKVNAYRVQPITISLE